jgi:hypothetical protein
MGIVLSALRALVGIVFVTSGVKGYIWWNALLKESGGADQGSGISVVVPNFVAMFLVILGLIFFVQGMIRIRKRSHGKISE